MFSFCKQTSLIEEMIMIIITMIVLSNLVTRCRPIARFKCRGYKYWGLIVNSNHRPVCNLETAFGGFWDHIIQWISAHLEHSIGQKKFRYNKPHQSLWSTCGVVICSKMITFAFRFFTCDPSELQTTVISIVNCGNNLVVHPFSWYTAS